MKMLRLLLCAALCLLLVPSARAESPKPSPSARVKNLAYRQDRGHVEGEGWSGDAEEGR